MGRIYSGISGPDIGIQRNLLNASNQLQQVTGRLATLQRINQGSDDPAGLIAAETIRAELEAIDAANSNAARAGAVVATADSALSQVSGLINTIEDAIVANAGGGLSEAETAAYQLEVDAAIEAINRIGSQANLAGQSLLDGSASELSFLLAANPADTVTLELPTVSSYELGNADGTLADLASGGSLSLASGESTAAQGVLDAARGAINSARGSLGAFEKTTIEASTGLIDSMYSSLSSAYSSIMDADVAMEAASLVQSELVLQAAYATLQVAGDRHRMTGLLLDAI